MKSTQLLLLAALSGAAVASAADPNPSPEAVRLQRGEYLVESIGLCADCHSPRNERGEFVQVAYLGGAPLGFAPTVPMPAWGPTAPAIAGLPSLTDAQAVKFLTTGVKPDGTSPRPPMPGYRFNAEDAAAVTAYLRSLAKKP